MNIHKCEKCNQNKELNDLNFKIEKRNSLGFSKSCKDCLNKERRDRRKINKYDILKKESEYRLTEKYKKYHNKYWDENKEKLKEKARLRYTENPDPFLERSKKQKVRWGVRYKKYQIEYRIKNREKLSRYTIHRYQTDIDFKLKHSLRTSLRKCLDGKIKKSKTLDYLGCSVEFFKGYLEAKFRDGMTWENRGSLWHLDHILPCRAFDFSEDEDIKKCFHYTNFQPLLISENLSKQDKMPDGKYARSM